MLVTYEDYLEFNDLNRPGVFCEGKGLFVYNVDYSAIWSSRT